MAAFKACANIFQIARGKTRGSLPCKDLLLLAIGRGQGKRKYPVVQSLARLLGEPLGLQGKEVVFLRWSGGVQTMNLEHHKRTFYPLHHLAINFSPYM